jgi:hypothetical protein
LQFDIRQSIVHVCCPTLHELHPAGQMAASGPVLFGASVCGLDASAAVAMTQ